MNEILTVAFFVIGNLIGVGFFMLPCEFAPLGMGMIGSWIIAISIALIYALIFGELAVLFPQSSVLSDYMTDKTAKKCVAYFYWMSTVISNVLLLNPTGLDFYGYKLIVSFVILLVITLMNHFLKYETIANIEIVLSALKFTLLIFMPLFIFFSNPDLLTFPTIKTEFNEILKIGITSFLAFIGIETASMFGKGKNMKKGLLIGVLVSFCLYFVASFIIIGMVPYEELMATRMPFVSLLVVGGYGYFAPYISFIIAFVCFCTLYGWVASASKAALFFAESDLFPEIFSLKTKSETSLYGLWLSSISAFVLYVLVNVFNVTSHFSTIADTAIYLIFIVYGMSAFVLFNKTESKFYKFVSCLGMILICFVLCADVIKSTISIGLLLALFLYDKKFISKEKISIFGLEF